MKSLEKALRQAMQSLPLENDEATLEQTVRKAQALYRQKRAEKRLSFWGLVLSQLRFMRWRSWLGQLAGVLVAAVCLLSVGARDAGAFMLRHGPFLLSGCSVVLVMFNLPWIKRSKRWQMAEVERASAYSYAGLLGARFVLLLLSDGLMFLVLGLSVAGASQLKGAQAALYLLLPFLLLASGYMLALAKGVLKRPEAVCWMMSAGMLLLLGYLDKYYPAFYSGAFNGVWLAVCLVLTGFLLRQWRYLLRFGYKQEEYGIKVRETEWN